MSNNYFNPFPVNFIETLNSDIYVDKTDLIIHLNKIIETNKKYVCVSRPRRFGKSVTADMLVAYYRYISETQKKTDEAETEKESKKQDTIFNNKKLVKYDGWKKYLGKFNVIKLDMFDCFSNTESIKEGIKFIKRQLIKEIKRSIPTFRFSKGSKDVLEIFEDIHYNTKLRIVLIIDEWDYVIRDEYKNNVKAQKKYIRFLTKLIKGKNYISLAYMTGILPIKKYGGQSSLGFFDEYSMTSPGWMAKYTGFTEDEVYTLCEHFLEIPNQNLIQKKQNFNKNNENEKTEKNKIKKENVKEKDLYLNNKKEFNFDRIQKWYNGYVLIDGKKEYHVYSPLSIVKALTKKEIKGYWNKTESFESLSDYINLNFDGLKEDIVILMDKDKIMKKKKNKIKISIEKYKNDMNSFETKDDILTMLVHLGYLGFNERKNEVFIPNEELKTEFKNCTEKSIEWETTFSKLKKSQELLDATWSCNESKVADLIEKAHNNGNNNTYNNEAALSYALQLAYYKATDYYTLFKEVGSGKGYADLIYIPKPRCNKPALLVELKYNKDAMTAIDQIKRQNYPERLEHYKNRLLIVDVNYDKDINNTSIKYNHHSCKIERYNEEKYLKEREGLRQKVEEEKMTKKRKQKIEEDNMKKKRKNIKK